MAFTDGWHPTYNNPDNHNLDPASEPYCPICDKEWIENEQQKNKEILNSPRSTRPLFI